MHFSVDTRKAGAVRESGLSLRHGNIHLKYLPGDTYRYSPVVSKRQGIAVRRNRVKRLVREIFRKGAGKNPGGSYLIFVHGECSSLNSDNISCDVNILIDALFEQLRKANGG
jgi:ribonuclease P protein component